MLALSEYIMNEPLPLATVQATIFDFCRDRDDLCVFGAQARSIPLKQRQDGVDAGRLIQAHG
jgi:hypothetical protein